MSNNYAVVTMANDYGYQRATSDVIRLFGVEVDGNVCRTRPASDYKYLYLQLHYTMSVNSVLQALK